MIWSGICLRHFCRSGRWRPPDHLAHYAPGTWGSYHSEYAEFARKVSFYFAKLHEHIKIPALIVAVPYLVHNTSGVSADGLRIETTACGDVGLCAPGYLTNARERFLRSPKAPKRPSPFDVYIPNLMPFSNIHEPMRPRDPTAFYWFDTPEAGGDYSSLQCENFRAKRQYDGTIFVLPKVLPASGTITIEISASNLPDPVIVNTTLTITERQAQWAEESVLDHLPQKTRNVLSQMLNP